MFVQFKVEALGEGERERERARETELQAEKEKVFRGGALSLLYMDVPENSILALAVYIRTLQYSQGHLGHSNIVRFS